MTDSLRHGGTLVSWNRSPSATSYEVERAAFTTVTLGLKAPVTAPNGWNFDDAMPTVTSVGAPGSVTTTLSIPGGFTPVATTDSPDYVDRTKGHYLYEVIAKSADGASSEPSNVGTAPFGGPPATFKELQSSLPTPANGAVAANVTPRQRLLAAAEAAAKTGRDGLARRDLAKLQAAAGGNDQLAAVAAHLRRRLRYTAIVGAPRP
jgi:hypothetical protein